MYVETGLAFLFVTLSLHSIIKTPGPGRSTLYKTTPTLNDPKEDGFKNTVGKGENAGN